jgi:hypothetical protein
VDQECCHSRLLGSAELRDVRALGLITMELMQGYVKDDGAIGVDDLYRWPDSFDAVGFLSETTSASSVDEVMKVSGRLTFLRHILIFSSTR